MRILIIEDDAEAARFIVKGLAESGHTADLATDGEAGLERALEEAYDALVVDRMLPKRDGLSVIEALREEGRDVPVLILSAMGDVDARVEGLRAGGDDYLPKPFAFSELLARIEVLGKRLSSQQAATTELTVAELHLDRLARRVTREGKVLHLQPREFRLLDCLMAHAGQVVTRTMLLEKVWDYHFDPGTNVIDVHMSRLRAKVDKDFDVALLHTVRGAGYMIREPDQ
jgi:two-component system OmpR family response regulator